MHVPSGTLVKKALCEGTFIYLNFAFVEGGCVAIDLVCFAGADLYEALFFVVRSELLIV